MLRRARSTTSCRAMHCTGWLGAAVGPPSSGVGEGMSRPSAEDARARHQARPRSPALAAGLPGLRGRPRAGGLNTWSRCQQTEGRTTGSRRRCRRPSPVTVLATSPQTTGPFPLLAALLVMALGVARALVELVLGATVILTQPSDGSAGMRQVSGSCAQSAFRVIMVHAQTFSGQVVVQRPTQTVPRR